MQELVDVLRCCCNFDEQIDNERQERILPGGMGGCIPPNILRGGDDNVSITPNIGRSCYAIAIKHSMSGDSWQKWKSILSIGGMI